MAEKLTPQQQMAVKDRGGKLLVSVAAGSGKTKVLVDRLLGYLTDEQKPANLDDFLIITYTKAAASELRGKIAAKLTERIADQPDNQHLQRQMQRLFLTKISTVHGFCGDILREYAYRLDLSADFRVADENECGELREQVLSDLLDQAYRSADQNPDFRAFVDTQGLGRDDRLVAEIVLKVYDAARCHLDPEGWLDCCAQASNTEELTDAGETVWGKYLTDSFFVWLDAQIGIMERCAGLAARAENMEKPLANLNATLQQLRELRESKNWDDIVCRSNVDFGRLTFPRKGIDTSLAEQIKACRVACKKGLEKQQRIFSNSSGQILKDLSDSAAAARGLIGLVRQFGHEYDRAKRSRRFLDFSDLEHKMLDLVLGRRRSAPTAAAREIGARFREIMVDEYQDSNGVQDAIFGALTEEKQNCFMVGDVKQSIYQFRLADPGIFLDKYSSFVSAENAQPGQGRKVLLSANFRSGGEVISAVNDVFRDCMSPAVGGLAYTEAELLREGIPHQKMPDAAVEFYGVQIREDTYAEEPAFVAQRIADMLDNRQQIRDGEGFRPIRPEDIVILLRSPGSVGARFRTALEARGIRCTSGGGTDLLKSEEIIVLRSLLQTIANPRQDIPLLSTLASPVFGFTADELAAMRAAHRQGNIYDALLADDGDKSRAFVGLLNRLRQSARMNTLAQLIEEIFTETALDSIFGAMDGGEGRRANLQTFFGIASDFESVSRRDLTQFLDYLQSMEEKGLKTEGEEASGAVTIMSIHKSKGLEFPVVFLCGLSREFNRENLRAQVLCDKELGLGLSVADTVNRVRYPAISKRAIAAKAVQESLSEELRVLYVAMTRARDRLIMTYASRNLEKDIQDLSLRYDICGGENLTRDVVSPGQWVLMSVLLRTEAGMLHNLGGRPSETRGSDLPWKIEAVQAPEAAAAVQAEEKLRPEIPEALLRRMKESLAFQYGYSDATRMPSKLTATQLKGRQKDSEAAEEAQEPKHIRRHWRKPSFAGGQPGGAARGSAVHTVMQHLNFDRCGSKEGIQKEIDRLVDKRFLTAEEAKAVELDWIAAFFNTEFGRMLCSGASHIREFKFSILDDAEHYGENLDGEKVLLQGVVDCAILEQNSIVVLDFKTDYVTEETLQEVAQRYRPQVRSYARALSRIYRMPVRASYLYFFRLNRFVEM